MVLPVHNPTKSYWIEAAESPLRDFRSTEELPAETDVVVVGSGYAGASAAYWIHKSTENAIQKPQMVLLEAREICSCATGRNGGQLRPHAYSRYIPWKERFGADGAISLIRHEVAHLPAFKALAEAEGIADEVCLKFSETFDAAMTDEAWTRLKGNYDAMRADHGDDNEVFRTLELIEDATKAEEFTQMKGALAAIVHPAGQVWPYKFVHALLRIVLEAGRLNLQAHTPAQSVSERDSEGWITVTTDRGTIKAKAVVHTTNRWASHLLPEFSKLILGDRATIAAIKAPEGFIKHTGAQHWDSAINNYHLQLPPPYNTIILGGGRQFLTHSPDACFLNDEEDKQIDGFAEFCQSWPKSDVKGWQGPDPADLARDVNDGGVWTGIETSSIDSFPFVGPVPGREGHFIAAGFVGHGMPRILGSLAHLTPLVLESLNLEHTLPSVAAIFPPLPSPFHATPERVQRLVQTADVAAKAEAYRKSCAESAAKRFCNDERSRPAGKGSTTTGEIPERRDTPLGS
ncbi:Putative FAD dependent oxidoreductase, FAD/NAD(P)-binding domain superfamily [Septoria linicola]|uniref:FAD dependent oxidoreductase, FAD/NAD(P)-binding domain superfamily n=1 Tax=Septoria linicola TaxID=215465 RepID=A0A9Q9EMM8_9PEZI|nr:putative FAD dependent oxidoreductase, FAD/NAD(P)-binding domain superfamily [Septoria linicola]USW54618.1 Putative FAD dependent oxidoreductase, FAD/NAD(P)-binding domain superfamily [Septoria linicola]